MPRRIVAAVAAALFAWMAVIQFNDPDPHYWFTVYAATAVVMAATVAARRVPRFALVTLGAVIAGLLMSAPGFVDYLQSGDWDSLGARMSPDRPYIESAREFIGLLIAAGALLALRSAKR